MLLVRTNSAAWLRMSCGTKWPSLMSADLKSDCVVTLRIVEVLFVFVVFGVFGGAEFTYTGPVAVGFCILRGPAATIGSGAASASEEDSYLLCTEGTGRPRVRMEAVELESSLRMVSMLTALPFRPSLLGPSKGPR
jgi:hypothetical protein